VIAGAMGQPAAETLLHPGNRFRPPRGAGAVLHNPLQAATLLSRRALRNGSLRIGFSAK